MREVLVLIKRLQRGFILLEMSLSVIAILLKIVNFSYAFGIRKHIVERRSSLKLILILVVII